MALALRVVVVSSVFYFFSYPEVDNDLWGHLFFGKATLETGSLPSQNIYSYTAPDHPWINHEWLAEVIFYWVYLVTGSPGLILLKVALGIATVWVLDLVIRGQIDSPLVRTLTLVWSMAILSPGFNVRPQIFTYFLLAAFLLLFYLYEKRSRRLLYWLPLLMIAWLNLHGGFVVGLGALALFSMWMAIERGAHAPSMKARVTRCLFPAGLCVLCLGLNPYGVDLLKFLWQDLFLDRPITEWDPVPLLDFSFPAFKLGVFTFLLAGSRNGAWRRWDFALTVLAALFAFRHQRHIPLFAIAAAPFLAKGVEWVFLRLKEGSREWLLATGVLAIALYQFLWIADIHWQHRFQLVVNPLDYPTQAADFLKRNGVRGNLAVPFDWGEYLIWKLYPEVRVSIDGRYTTAYPTQVIQDHWDWMQGGNGWRRLLERYPTDIAITNRRHPVTALLRKDPEWVYIYSDPVAFVFVRKTPSQEALLAKFKEKRLLPPLAPPIYFPG
jgi:hypothetical protein